MDGMPDNFRWIQKNVLAGSAIPKTIQDIRFFYDQGIRTIISFQELSVDLVSEIKRLGIIHVTIEIEDYGIPNQEGINLYFSVLDKALPFGPVLLHCAGGIGQTRTMAALYLILKKDLSAGEAMYIVGKVESPDQERLIRFFAQEGKDLVKSLNHKEEKMAETVTLKEREMKVLELLIEGKSSKEVADALFVSKRTVDKDIANVYDKLQVTNRVQAFRRAVRLGLLKNFPSP